MRLKSLFPIILSLALLSLFSPDILAGRRVRTFGHPNTDQAKKSAKSKDKKKAEKPFKELIKDREIIEGLFTFYRDTTDNTLLMAILPEQMGPIFLCGETRSSAEGAFFDNGSMGRSFPFYFKRVGKNIMMLEKNLRLRADTASTLHKAVKNGISDHLFASTKIKSKPDDSTKAILIDPADLFIRDAQHLSYFLGQSAKLGFGFDRKNSFFGVVKSFPQNSEIDVRLHYKTSKPLYAATMQNPYDLFHTIHYSLSTLPETDYVPRIADDRIGYFLTMYEDYSTLDKNTPYVRYINRWNLKKKNPDARISDPVEPIVYWVENTVPDEYRDAVAEGIEFWNKSFEKIGYRNAIVAKQMPDTATWDPADVRYNTVRWIIIPGGGYAVGPSHANPFTGQIYDADIRVSADFIRYMYNNMEYYINPLSLDGIQQEQSNAVNLIDELHPNNPQLCTYGAESAMEAAFGLEYSLSIASDLADKDSLTRKYVYSYIVELVAHEIGHTLGLRHNFKASTIYTMDQINDPNFTREHSTGGTIMDYGPPNLAGPGRKQGEFYASVPGPYDDWAIEYGYEDFGVATPEAELPMLNKIAKRAPDPTLVYGTDEDAFGTSPKAIDPMCNLFDQGDDPLAYAKFKVGLTQDLWHNSMSSFEKPGKSYQEVLRAFSTGWRAYWESAQWASRYVGGIYNNRYHVGDTTGVLPFQPVSAAKQRQAVAFLVKNYFAPHAFDLPANLLNKLQPERLPDFSGRVFSMSQIDYPIHQQILAIQDRVLFYLYNPYTLGRLVNNEERYAPGDDIYTMHDMFTDIRHGIWSEIVKPENVNSFRRQLQLRHLKWIIALYLSNSSSFPSDSRTLAANDLDILESAAKKAIQSNTINSMTKAHYKEVLRQIKSAKGAKRTYSKM